MRTGTDRSRGRGKQRPYRNVATPLLLPFLLREGTAILMAGLGSGRSLPRLGHFFQAARAVRVEALERRPASR